MHKIEIEIEEPWTMIPLSEVDYFINFIKSNLPQKEELINCDFFPEVKINGKNIYIVQDKDTGEYYHIDFHKKSANQDVTSLGDIAGFIKKMKEK